MIAKADKKDYLALMQVWESAVCATHNFLLPEDFGYYKSRIPLYFDHVDLYVYKTGGEVTAFLGVADSKIEMLFVHNDYRGKGIGSRLMDFALHTLHATKVDVNEQNEAATGFYKRFGFKQTGRTETDGEGKPYPIVEMELV